jgi:hypothetical protein
MNIRIKLGVIHYHKIEKFEDLVDIHCKGAILERLHLRYEGVGITALYNLESDNPIDFYNAGKFQESLNCLEIIGTKQIFQYLKM